MHDVDDVCDDVDDVDDVHVHDVEYVNDVRDVSLHSHCSGFGSEGKVDPRGIWSLTETPPK